MPKLNLKRTPEEEAHKAEKRRRKKHLKRKQPRSGEEHRERKWASDDESLDEPYGPPPPPDPSSSPIGNNYEPHDTRFKPDYDAIRAELEEKRFRENLACAFNDDERLDSVEAHFNNFAHVPDRWQSAGASSSKASRRVQDEFVDEFLKMDPAYMDEEEYAEWIRAGMYRKTHAAEYAEQQRVKAAKAERRAQEKAAKAETARLEKLAEEERKHRKTEKENLYWTMARDAYDRRWKVLLSKPPDVEQDDDGNSTELRFEDIPWPVVTAYPKPSKRHRDPKRACALTLDHISTNEIARFISVLPTHRHSTDEEAAREDKKVRKDRLREAMLRFHPDKFEGRVMRRVHTDDKEKVRMAVGQVARSLNALMTAD